MWTRVTEIIDPMWLGIFIIWAISGLSVKRTDVHPDAKIQGPHWNFWIGVTLPNGVPDFLASGSAPLDANGRPESGPSLYIDKRVGIDGTTQRVDIEGLDKSLTDFALDEASRLFEATFGHPPEKLPGSLIDDNRAIFQRAYLAEIDAGTDPNIAKIKAASLTWSWMGL